MLDAGIRDPAEAGEAVAGDEAVGRMNLAAQAASSVLRNPSTTLLLSLIGWPSWFLASASTKGGLVGRTASGGLAITHAASVHIIDFDHAGPLPVGVPFEQGQREHVLDAPSERVRHAEVALAREGGDGVLLLGQ